MSESSTKAVALRYRAVTSPRFELPLTPHLQQKNAQQILNQVCTTKPSRNFKFYTDV
jgi:hypothetical protein